MINVEITVNFEGKCIKNSKHPKYLGVTLNHSLTYNQHLIYLAQKLKSSADLISKLTNSNFHYAGGI